MLTNQPKLPRPHWVKKILAIFPNPMYNLKIVNNIGTSQFQTIINERNLKLMETTIIKDLFRQIKECVSNFNKEEQEDKYTIYNIHGKRIPQLQEGINIIIFANGKVIKKIVPRQKQ